MRAFKKMNERIEFLCSRIGKIERRVYGLDKRLTDEGIDKILNAPFDSEEKESTTFIRGIDWDTIPEGTRIQARNDTEHAWCDVFFQKVWKNRVYASFCSGSLTYPWWKYARLIEPRPGIDWSRVPLDTPIFVRDDSKDAWIPRYFVRHENGRVFAWASGRTSFSRGNYGTAGWQYAKLALEDSNEK